ncbi:MAG: hypothetical protein ACREPX_01630 [Rhodanobacteraceae bacterium]
MRRALFCALFTLSGCASSPPDVTPQSLTQDAGQRFAGQPVQVMLARYGAPLRQQVIAGETVYTWERSNVITYRTRPSVRVSCQLDAYVSASGIVRTIGFNGQDGACPMFAP